MRRWSIIISVLLLCALILGCRAVERGTVPPENFTLGEDISIEGVDVSRKEIWQAREMVREQIEKTIRSMQFDIYLKNGDKERSARIQGTELPIETDLETVLREAAYLPQHNGLRQNRREFDVSLRLDTEEALAQVQALCTSFYVAPVDATVKVDRSQDGMFAYTAESTGLQALPEELMPLLSQSIQREEGARISLPFETLHPRYTEAQARNEHQLISQFSTSFAKSPYNASGRVANIKQAAGLIDGTRLQPDEEFNINAILGPRNKANGWHLAAGIRDGRYQQEYGGGVCQVSTTLFNAVMMADLEISERHLHSWPSGYVDIGRDATISTDGPNFRFINTSDCDIYVFAQTDSSKKITVSLYGKPLPDDMHIKISSKRIATLSSLGEDVLLDESLPANTRLVYREARRGKKSETYKEYYDANGGLVRRQLAYADTYRSIRGTVYISSDLYYGVPDEEESTEIITQ
ncbi:MAG: VanW family protein [Bacillota bacterium]